MVTCFSDAVVPRLRDVIAFSHLLDMDVIHLFQISTSLNFKNIIKQWPIFCMLPMCTTVRPICIMVGNSALDLILVQ